MKNPHRGHLFGSDADMCDVLLDANNDDGISRVHFRLLLELGEKNDQPETLWIINNSSSGHIVVNSIQVPFNQQHGLKPRVVYTVDAGPAHLCIVFADHCLDTGALNELRAARREPNRIIGQRMIKMTRRQTPLFNSNLDECTTHPDIPWHHKGQYIMQNKILGGGNHSTVRKARRSVEGTLVAIKIIGNGNGGLNQQQSDLMLQVNKLIMMLRTDHTHIVRLLDYVRYEPTPCATLLALEFAPYGTLHTQFQYTKAGEDLCKTILSQVLAALQFLEKESVVHRDVSPDNSQITTSLRRPRITATGGTFVLVDLTCTMAAYRSLVNHVFLPPELPQSNAGNAFDTLVYTTSKALVEYERLRADQHLSVEEAIRMAGNMAAVHVDSYIDEEKLACLMEAILCEGGSVVLYISAQNTGMIISRFCPLDTSFAIRFEAFELSPLNQAVYHSRGRLSRSSPGSAIDIDIPTFAEPGLVDTIAHTLAKMSIQAAPGMQPQVRKASAVVDDDRDTTHPGMISKFIMGFLNAIGQVVTLIPSSRTHERRSCCLTLDHHGGGLLYG
ncbi:hypothetical protein LTR22_024305 [Elasticomyces elasticus]|nr:hypothetical protein LTR22_024305 [Elasticomyces elasticus]